MRLAILHNQDFGHLPPGVGRRAHDSVLGVAAAVAQALARRGAEVDVIPVGLDPLAFAPQFLRTRPDVVLNLCESLAGDARGEMVLPGLLDLVDIPYTGSGPLGLALSLHKDKAKEVLLGRGIPTPAFALVASPAAAASVDIGFPVIVKPSREDASVGIHRDSVVHSAADLRRACERVLDEHGQPALVERYVEGREINVALLGDPPEALPLAEIDFGALERGHPRIVTYAAKWDEAAPEFSATPPVRCRLPAEVERRVVGTARAAFEALACRDYGRVDIRLSEDGVPFVIEVNPNCDLSPEAGFARAARAAGVSYEALVWRLVGLARDRDHDRPSAVALRSRGAGASARRDRGIHAERGRVRARARRPGPRDP